MFTRNERSAIVMMVTLALLGTGVDYLYKKIPAAKSIRRIGDGFVKTNINTASRLVLMEVPGIGEVIAGRIIVYRNQNSGIHHLDELRSIKGITDRRFTQLKEYLAVE